MPLVLVSEPGVTPAIYSPNFNNPQPFYYVLPENRVEVNDYLGDPTINPPLDGAFPYNPAFNPGAEPVATRYPNFCSVWAAVTSSDPR